MINAFALAATVGSTPATCHRRYKKLRRLGVIQRIVALVDGTRSEESLTVLLGLTMREQSSQSQRKLRQFFHDRPEIKMAWMTTGEVNYFLVGAFPNMASYLKILEIHVHGEPSISSHKTFISLDEVKSDTARSFSKQLS